MTRSAVLRIARHSRESGNDYHRRRVVVALPSFPRKRESIDFVGNDGCRWMSSRCLERLASALRSIRVLHGQPGAAYSPPG